MLSFTSSTGDGSPLSAEVDDWETALTCAELDSITTHEKKLLIYATHPVEVKKPELKPLPPSLRYAFLDESENYTVIRGGDGPSQHASRAEPAHWTGWPSMSQLEA